jgi:phytol kinase
MAFILTILAVFVVLVTSEIGWRKHWLNNEVGRKFTHIVVGSFVAFWPFFLSWTQIRILSVAFLVVVIASHQFKIFRAINSVQRPTYGEIFFAITVGALTFITQSKAVYAAALLQMSLADGFAAIVGTRYGRDNKYHILGNTKSIAGTAAFLVTALVIFVGFALLSTVHLSILLVLIAVVVAAALENLAPLGLDNLLVPLFIGLLLEHF